MSHYFFPWPEREENATGVTLGTQVCLLLCLDSHFSLSVARVRVKCLRWVCSPAGLCGVAWGMS